MDSMIASIAGVMTIADLTYKFIKNLGVESTPELKREVNSVLGTINFNATTEESLLANLKKIPQLAYMTNDHIKKQFENIYNECTNSNVAQNISANNNTTIQANQGAQIHYYGTTPTAPAQNNTSHIKQLCIDFLECANTIFNDKRLYADYDIAIEIPVMAPTPAYSICDDNRTDKGVALFLGAKDYFITQNGLPKSVADDVIIKTIDLFSNLFINQYITFRPNEKLLFRIKSKNLITEIDRNVIGINSDQITSCIDRLKSGSCDQYL